MLVALTQVTTWYLAMPDPGRLRPKLAPRPDASLMQATIPCPELNAFFYRTVGKDYYWTDRLPWSDEEWRRWVDGVQTWIGYVAGTPCGYFELQDRRTPEGHTVNIVLFGLLPWAIGQGLGGWLLTQAIERAWALGPDTVIVNTCSLDGPHALPNYQARGFAIQRIVTSAVNLGGGA